MTRLPLAFLTSLFLLQLTGARSAQTAPTGSSNSSTRQEQQSVELEEARQLNQKVVQLYQAGKLDEALPLAKRVLQLRERALGKEHQLVTEALINLGEINLAKKLYRESLSNYERILKSNEKVAGPDDASNAVLMDKIAFLRYMIADFNGAENFYKRSLAIYDKVSGAESEQAAQSAYNLAEFYRFTNSFQKAAPLYQRALPVLEKTLGPEHPKLIGILESYACLLSKLKRESESEDFWKRTGEMRSRAINERLKAKGAQAIQGDRFSTSQPISKPQPIYPAEAKSRRLMGKVTVRVMIDGTGKVVRACASGADPILLDAAEQAAMSARFSPLIVEGIPIETMAIIFYSFMIR